MTLSRLKEIDRVVKILALADDPRQERPEEAASAAALAVDLLRDYAMIVIIPRERPVRMLKIRDALQGTPAAGTPVTAVCLEELRFSSESLVHPKSVALGQFCFFTGDHYLFVATRDVTLE